MSKLVFRHIHYESCDWSNGRVCSRARTRLILPLLVIGFPLQAKLEAGLSALLRVGSQPSHLVLIHAAAKSESAAEGKSYSKCRQNRHFGQL